MFNKNMYMFPHCSDSPSSYPHTSAPFVGGDIFLHHHLPGHYPSATGDAAAFDISGLNGDPSAMENLYNNTKASKKDRHSKIYTAQGPRDRRVRLSIGVARKFFDLQESLGFDKPSKTLDWLLTKSKSAIKDLVQMREKASSNAAKSGSSAPSEEVDSREAFENGADSNQKLASDKLKPTLATNLVKESRVKARARARERTREKMSIKKLNETRNNGGYDLSPNIPIQFMNNQDLIQESILIKRKVMGFQQNLFISSSNYGGQPPYSAAADHNWDIFTSSQSNICAILDQHKFMNG